MQRAGYLLSLLALAGPLRAQLGAPNVPNENPITEEKRILGKLLFWEEQLSSDNTMACGTCHQIYAGGADDRFARHYGRDDEFYTYDDFYGSRGVRPSTSSGDFTFTGEMLSETGHQVVQRNSMSFFMAAYNKELMWDGRVTEEFVDPETGVVLISNKGALEGQVLGPILSEVEMAYPDRTWDDVRQKLAIARPLALATDLPPDMAAAIAGGASYPALFEDAFGDPEITAARIAFAIATYERTLIPDQTPWDLFKAGDSAALTSEQQSGEQLFKGVARCNLCHDPPTFTDDRFHNIGLRPPLDDKGRYHVTHDFDDMGRFKTPSLRNVSLRPRIFHTGRQPEFLGPNYQGLVHHGKSLVARALTVYVLGGGPHPGNLSSFILPLPELSESDVDDIVDFVENGLTDPRPRDGLFPFDSPTLFSDSSERGINYVSTGIPGRAGLPELIVEAPPVVDGGAFRLGVIGARPGSLGWVSVQPVTAPAGSPSEVTPWDPQDPLFNSSPGFVDGKATWQVVLTSDTDLIGRELDVCWCFYDDSVPTRISKTRTVRLTVH